MARDCTFIPIGWKMYGFKYSFEGKGTDTPSLAHWQVAWLSLGKVWGSNITTSPYGI